MKTVCARGWRGERGSRWEGDYWHEEAFGGKRSDRNSTPRTFFSSSQTNDNIPDLIKMVKPVHSKRMQVWMGAKVTPSKDVTGGLWYHNGELLETQIHDLYDKCCNVLRAKPDHAWSVDDVCNVLGLPDQATRMKGILKLLVLDRIAKEVKRLEGGLMGASEGSSFGRGESSFGGATASSGMFGGAEMGGSLLDNDDSMGGSLLGGFGGSAAFGGSSSSAFGGMGSDLGGPASRKRRAPGNTSELSLGGEEHSSELSTLYQAVAKEPKFSWTRLRDLPCTRCKVRSTCDANVMFSATPNPVSCRYLTEWLYNDKTIAAQEQVAGGVGGGGGRIGGAVGGGSAALPVKGTGGRAVGDIEDVL